jgi:hypothetical protein
MKEKIMIALASTVTGLVLISLTAYFSFTRTIGIVEVTSIAIISIIVAFAIYIIWDRARNVSKGLPVQDERLKNISYKAGYYGFIAAIWSAVFAPVFTDIIFGQELEGHLVTAVVVIVAGVVFAISYFYLAWKGN